MARKEFTVSKIVAVDRDACIACGLCVSVAPEVFRLEDGASLAYNPQGADEEKIQQCIDGCPVTAIYWQEE
jgi:ferredoxin